MAARATPEKKASNAPRGRTPKGSARFESEGNGKTLEVRVDRQGFRRLLQTLERLAATGERQTFERSGRGRRSTGDGKGENHSRLEKIVFHIEDRS